MAEELERVTRRSFWPSGRSWRLLSELTWAVRQGRAADAERIADEIAVAAAANGQDPRASGLDLADNAEVAGFPAVFEYTAGGALVFNY